MNLCCFRWFSGLSELIPLSTGDDDSPIFEWNGNQWEQVEWVGFFQVFSNPNILVDRYHKLRTILHRSNMSRYLHTSGELCRLDIESDRWVSDDRNSTAVFNHYNIGKRLHQCSSMFHASSSRASLCDLDMNVVEANEFRKKKRHFDAFWGAVLRISVIFITEWENVTDSIGIESIQLRIVDPSRSIPRKSQVRLSTQTSISSDTRGSFQN